MRSHLPQELRTCNETKRKTAITRKKAKGENYWEKSKKIFRFLRSLDTKMLSISPISFLDSDTEDNSDSVLSGSAQMSELDLFDGLVSLAEQDRIDTVTPKMQAVKSNQDARLLGYISQKNMKVISIVKEEQSQKDKQYAPCMSRNAINARENRQKKKEYVKNLEESVDMLKSENSELKNECESLKKTVTNLTDEVEYLKGVLANQSTLASILHKISDIPGLSLSTSFKTTEKNNNSVTSQPKRSNQKRCLENQENEGKNNVSESKKCKVTRSSSKQAQQSTKNGSSTKGICENSSESVDMSTNSKGICLHISGSSVSVELCEVCSKKSKKNQEKDHSYGKISV